jgi:hypothetical protein
MTEWLLYRCDDGHSWDVQVDGAEPLDPRCPHGHEPVTVQRLRSADRVRISFVPAARTVDTVTGKVDRDDAYYLEIANADLTESRRSGTAYPWNEAVARASTLHGATWGQALLRWDRSGWDARAGGSQEP